jgi:hypothetical protein
VCGPQLAFSILSICFSIPHETKFFINLSGEAARVSRNAGRPPHYIVLLENHPKQITIQVIKGGQVEKLPLVNKVDYT